MTLDLSLLSGFGRGVLLSLHVRDTCLHSGSWLLSGLHMKRGLFLCWSRAVRGPTRRFENSIVAKLVASL